MTTESGPLPVPASVLFLRMRGFADDLPSTQQSRRERLAAVVQALLAAWDNEHRVVLEAPDGLAIVGEVEPAKALAGARLVAEQGADANLGIGLHHGPVRALQDGSRVVGDGIDTAAVLAGFAASQPIVASQAFREALALRAPRLAEDLQPAGEQVDERLRPHALYVFDPQPARHRASRRKVVAGTGVMVLLAAGWAGRELRESYEEARRPAVILLDVRPFGEVFVDGDAKGSSPPLVRLSLPAGPHTIEVRNGRFRPLLMQVLLQPGEEMQVKHLFTAPPAPPRRARQKEQPGLLDRFKFW
jgi:class 3 adenylate cyclase